MRRFLKGDEGMIQDVICQLKNQDTQLYNYIASHNGFTLCDVVSYDGKHNEANGENNLDGPDYNTAGTVGQKGTAGKRWLTSYGRIRYLMRSFYFYLHRECRVSFPGMNL